MTLFTSTSLVSSYYILKTYNNKFAITSYNIRPEFLKLYKSTYTKEFRKKAFKNISIGSVAIGLGALIFVNIVESGLEMGPGPIFTPPDA